MSQIEQEHQALQDLHAWLQTGDPKRFDRLYEQASRWMHWAVAQKFARAGCLDRDPMRDIVGDCWERLARRNFQVLRSFEPHLDGDRGLRAFFQSVAGRRAQDYLARSSTKAGMTPAADPDSVPTPSDDRRIEARDTLERLLGAFQFRSEDQKRRFISLFVDQSSAHEEQARSGRSIAAIYSWARDIRSKARQWRNQHEQTHGGTDDQDRHPSPHL